MSMSIPDQQLTTHFALSDLTTTSSGLDNTPNADEIAQLTQVANLLEQIYQQIGPISVNSAFRSDAVNTAAGGSPTSQHRYGEAADIVPTTFGSDYVQLFLAIYDSPLASQICQLILEPDQQIVHVSIPGVNQQTGVQIACKDEIRSGAAGYTTLTDDEIASIRSGTSPADIASGAAATAATDAESGITDPDADVDDTGEGDNPDAPMTSETQVSIAAVILLIAAVGFFIYKSKMAKS